MVTTDRKKVCTYMHSVFSEICSGNSQEKLQAGQYTEERFPLGIWEDEGCGCFCHKDKNICLHSSFLQKLNLKLLGKYSKLCYLPNIKTHCVCAFTLIKQKQKARKERTGDCPGSRLFASHNTGEGVG